MKLNVKIELLALSLLSLVLLNCQQQKEDFKIEQTEDYSLQIEQIIEKLTLEEKVSMIHANSAFTTGGVERLGIPELTMSDGPHGVRHEFGRDWIPDEGVLDSGTYLPTGTALAATWNPKLGYDFGTVLGNEAKFRGKDIILGPGLNIIRTPLNGRNFEYMTEDPYLNSKMVVGYIKGVQDQNVAACAKHYIANNQEIERMRVNVQMSERALREIYLPGFIAAVKEGEVLTVMGAYNKFRGQYCSHNEYLVQDILKGELDFQGALMSDWNAVHSTMEALKYGTDIEMGTDLGMLPNPDYSKFYLGDTVITLVESGKIDESIIDEKVRRILRVMFETRMFGERGEGAYNTEEHQSTALKIAEEAVTLLKNDNILPLKREELKSLAVIGANAFRKQAGGGGSSQVSAFYEITPAEGIKNIAGDGIEISYAEGYKVEKGGGADQQLIAEAVEAAKNADASILVCGWIHGYTDIWEDNAFDAEDIDKPSMVLPFGQDELINSVLAANPNTIVVLVGGGPVDMRNWINDTKGLIQGWYAGMEGGTAIARVIFGDVNPSGKLPMTFPKKLDDSPAHAIGEYPGEDLSVKYNEGIFVGYRYFDTYDVEPQFAFGHGLSYTTFEYKDLKVSKIGENQVSVEFTLTNTGNHPGAEVAQIYVSDLETEVEKATKELKSFEKIMLQPGESKTIKISLDENAFSYYNEEEKGWKIEPGVYEILVGSSSRDIRVKDNIEL